MIALDVAQGSAEWHAARAGLPTASNFDRLLTPAKLEPSRSWRKYRNHLIAEWLLGQAIVDESSSGFMVRGQDQEQEARDYYEMARGVEVLPGGFCLRDDRSAGCSPDALVWEDGLAEIKIPSAENHVGYLLDGLGDDHNLQMQGCMWVTGRSWLDFLSYNRTLPKVLIRVARDEAVIKIIDREVTGFANKLAATKADLVSRGYLPLPPKKSYAEERAFHVGVG